MGTTFEIHLAAISKNSSGKDIGSADTILKFSRVILFATIEDLIENYRAELGSLDVEYIVESDLELSDRDSFPYNALIVLDGEYGGTRGTVNVLRYAEKSEARTAMINQPLSDAVTNLGAEFDYCTQSIVSIQEIVDQLEEVVTA